MKRCWWSSRRDVRSVKGNTLLAVIVGWIYTPIEKTYMKPTCGSWTVRGIPPLQVIQRWAHSLGCVTLLRYLNRQSARIKIGGAILVSGYVEMIPKYPKFKEFVEIDLDMKKLIAMANKRCVFSAPNDTIIDYKYSRNLAMLFDAKLITIEGGGHFIGQEGFSEFPELFDELCAMIGETHALNEPNLLFAVLYKKQKNLQSLSLQGFFREAPAGFEPAIKVLQTSALPLGYGAIIKLPELVSNQRPSG